MERGQANRCALRWQPCLETLKNRFVCDQRAAELHEAADVAGQTTLNEQLDDVAGGSPGRGCLGA